MTLPLLKRCKLRKLLTAWPPSRCSASAKHVSQLIDFLFQVSFAVRPGSYFVQRMLASVGMPLIAAGAGFPCRVANLGRRIALGPEFHGDLEFRRWLVAEGLAVERDALSAPMYYLLEYPARRALISGASKTAIGCFFLETGVYWRYELSSGDQCRFCVLSKVVAGAQRHFYQQFRGLGHGGLGAGSCVPMCRTPVRGGRLRDVARGQRSCRGVGAAVSWGQGPTVRCTTAPPWRTGTVIWLAFRCETRAWNV